MVRLSPLSPLETYSRDWNGISLHEISNCELVAVAVAHRQDAKLARTFKKHYGGSLPKPAECKPVRGGNAIWSAPDQFFLLLEGSDERADIAVSDKLGDCAYATLQTDGWAHLSLTGSALYDVLERFTALDIRQFEIGRAERSAAHHIALFIIKISHEEFRILTPRSSCKSFVEAFEHVIGNVTGSHE